VLGDDSKPHGDNVGERTNHFEISQSDAFAASGFRLVPDIFGLTAESGLNRKKPRSLGSGKVMD
jgi:hypothetical protein